MVNAFISQLLGYLVDFAQYVQKFFGDAGFSKFNYGWLVALFFVFAVILAGLNLGRSRVLLWLIGLYIAAFLEPHFVYFGKLSELFKNKPEFWLHIGLFLVIYFLSVAILSRSSLKQPLTSKETSFLSLVFIAVLETGFLASLVVSYLPPDVGKKLPSTVLRFFGTENARFWWALAPLVMLLFLKRNKKKLISEN